jgi:hypothetical protein
MQKAFSLQPDEVRQAMAIDEERKNLLAQYGALELERKRVRKTLPTLDERQRGLVRTALSRLKIDQFNGARIDNGNLIVDLPDDAAAALPAPPAAEHVNGVATEGR